MTHDLKFDDAQRVVNLLREALDESQYDFEFEDVDISMKGKIFIIKGNKLK